MLATARGVVCGTGCSVTGGTTALCLDWLCRRRPAGETIIDYGCGSGILAIAALKLGAVGPGTMRVEVRALDPPAVDRGGL